MSKRQRVQHMISRDDLDTRMTKFVEKIKETYECTAEELENVRNCGANYKYRRSRLPNADGSCYSSSIDETLQLPDKYRGVA